MLRCAVVLLLVITAVSASPLRADDDDDDWDHERARILSEGGVIRPLSEVLARLGREVPGEVVEIELGEDDGRHEYQFTVVARDGRLFEVKMDAATLDILETEEDD